MLPKFRKQIEIKPGDVLEGIGTAKKDVDIQFTLDLPDDYIHQGETENKARKRRCCHICGCLDKEIDILIGGEETKVRKLVEYGSCKLGKGGYFLLCRDCKRNCKENNLTYAEILREGG